MKVVVIIHCYFNVWQINQWWWQHVVEPGHLEENGLNENFNIENKGWSPSQIDH